MKRKASKLPAWLQTLSLCFSLRSVFILSLYCLGHFSLAGQKYPRPIAAVFSNLDLFIRGIRTARYNFGVHLWNIIFTHIVTRERSKCRSAELERDVCWLQTWFIRGRFLFVTSTPLCHFPPNSLIWPDAADGSLNQNAGHWLDYHGRITGIFEKPRSVDWFGLNRIWLWVRDGELVSAGVGGLWVWCSEREWGRERLIP